MVDFSAKFSSFLMIRRYLLTNQLDNVLRTFNDDFLLKDKNKDYHY